MEAAAALRRGRRWKRRYGGGVVAHVEVEAAAADGTDGVSEEWSVCGELKVTGALSTPFFECHDLALDKHNLCRVSRSDTRQSSSRGSHTH